MSEEQFKDSLQLKSSSFAQNELELGSSECASILTYPRQDPSEASRRLKELESLGVKSLIPSGRTMVAKTTIAGKGCVGLVVKARAKPDERGPEEIYALKVRRMDANRSSMHDEARMQKIANSAGVGPRLQRVSDNFLLMDFVQGPSIFEWAKQNPVVSASVVEKLVSLILTQCYLLDRAGLDHGELSRLDRHIIISTKGSLLSPTVIDFESASTARRTANVTSAAQALFLGGGLVAKRIGGSLGNRINRDELVSSLSRYKQNPTRASFEAVLSAKLGQL